MSEFTLDIQLTELGFSSWNLPHSEPQRLKVTNFSTPNAAESPASVTHPSEDCHEDVQSVLSQRSFLLDHQYCSPNQPSSFSDIDDSSNPGEEPETEKPFDYIEYIVSEGDDNEEEEEEEEENVGDGEDDLDEDCSLAETHEYGGKKKKCCPVCDLTFSNGFLFREHLNIHMGIRPYRCDECGKQFCQLINYRSHLRSHANRNASFHCPICTLLFETEELLQEHLQHNHLEKHFYQCDFCKQIFSSLKDCNDHIEDHKQQVKRHLCMKCGSRFGSRNSLLCHLEWHSKGVFSCPDCKRTFHSKGALLRHSFFHLGVLPYTCMKCRRHFRKASHYYDHECKPGSIQCMSCFVFFQSPDDFEKHKKDTGCWGVQRSMPTKMEEIRCIVCGKVFSSTEELKKHGITHQKGLKCAECGMGFRSSIILMSHMGGHAGKRPRFCKDCGLGFPHQQGYDIHLKTCGMEHVSKKPKAKPSSTPPSLSQPSNGKWKLTLDKEPPSGVQLVMFLPVPATTEGSSMSSKCILPSSMILETPSTSTQTVPLTVVQSTTFKRNKASLGPEMANVPSKTMLSSESDGSTSKKRWTIVKDDRLDEGNETSKVCELVVDMLKRKGPSDMVPCEASAAPRMAVDEVCKKRQSGEQPLDFSFSASSRVFHPNSTRIVDGSKEEVKSSCTMFAKDEKPIKASSSNSATSSPAHSVAALCLLEVKEEVEDIEVTTSKHPDSNTSLGMTGDHHASLKIKSEELDSSSSPSGSSEAVQLSNQK